MGSVITFDDDAIIVSKTEDVSAVLEATKAKHNAGEFGATDMKLAASIPAIVVESYCTRIGITMQEFMQNKAHANLMLNDSSLSHFRVWKGQV